MDVYDVEFWTLHKKLLISQYVNSWLLMTPGYDLLATQQSSSPPWPLSSTSYTWAQIVCHLYYEIISTLSIFTSFKVNPFRMVPLTDSNSSPEQNINHRKLFIFHYFVKSSNWICNDDYRMGREKERIIKISNMNGLHPLLSITAKG